MWGGKPAWWILVALLFGGVLLAFFVRSPEQTTVYEPVVPRVDPGSPVPWRNAEQEMTNWFPGATHHQIRDLVLSSRRPELQAKLNRPVLPEEMSLHLYQVRSNETVVGFVLTRRFKTKTGAMELVAALSEQGELRVVKIQRSREPEQVLKELERFDLARSLKPNSIANGNQTTPGSPETINLAEKIGEEVRAMLVLFEAARPEMKQPIRAHH
jgi:hypothetical protein